METKCSQNKIGELGSKQWRKVSFKGSWKCNLDGLDFGIRTYFLNKVFFTQVLSSSKQIIYSGSSQSSGIEESPWWGSICM